MAKEKIYGDPKWLEKAPVDPANNMACPGCPHCSRPLGSSSLAWRSFETKSETQTSGRFTLAIVACSGCGYTIGASVVPEAPATQIRIEQPKVETPKP